MLPKVLVGLNFFSLYTHVQNDNVINTNEQVNDIQNGIQKEVLGLMLTVSWLITQEAMAPSRHD